MDKTEVHNDNKRGHKSISPSNGGKVLSPGLGGKGTGWVEVLNWYIWILLLQEERKNKKAKAYLQDVKRTHTEQNTWYFTC